MSATLSHSNDNHRGLKRSFQDMSIDTEREAIQALWLSLEEARSDTDAISKLRNFLDAEVDRLRDEQAVAKAEKRRLERVQGRIETQIRDWELARPFHYFLQLPVELRGLIWDEYFVHEFRQSEYRRDCVRRGFTKPVTLVCKRVREEVIDWLCVNRPYMIIFWAFGSQRGGDSLSKLEVEFMDGGGDGPRSWRVMPEELLARVRHVKIGLNSRYIGSDSFPRWSLDLASEEVKMESIGNHDHQHACDVLDVEYRSLVKDRLQVVLKAIMEQGVMHRRHFHLLFHAVATKRDGSLQIGAEELAVRSVK